MKAATYLKNNGESFSKCLQLYAGNAAKERAEQRAREMAGKAIELSKFVRVIGDDHTEVYRGGYAIVRRQPKHSIVALCDCYGETTQGENANV